MSTEFKAKLDKKGSETARSFHFTFGSMVVGGGVYVDKLSPIPDQIIITFPKEEEKK